MFQLNQPVYFVHGTKVIKANVEEVIRHQTQEKLIVKYILRPYGIANFVTIDEAQVFNDLDVAKSELLKVIFATYTKENILAKYNKERERLENILKSDMDNFDEILKGTVESINNASDEKFDAMEKSYQDEQAKKNEESK